MTAKTFRIEKVTRSPQYDAQDALKFSPGVNLIVGDLNSGKTKWLQMIDFALGDGSPPEKTFSAELAEKYESIVLEVSIGHERHVIERRWKEKNSKTKIFVDGNGMFPDDFSQFMLESLGIPRIERPLGNPYERDWIELSWRELFRHMYKWERPWDGFVERQHLPTRSACILHFVQSTQQHYLESFGTLVRKRKELSKLKAQLDLFADVLQDIALDVARHPELSVAVTPDSIAGVRSRLLERSKTLSVKRNEILSDQDRDISASTPDFEAVRQRLLDLHEQQREADRERLDAKRREAELENYKASLAVELNRFDRTKAGASVFADLKVTHCPACDQEVKLQRFGPDSCHVCGQPHPRSGSDGHSTAIRRVEFEEDQIREEMSELEELIKSIRSSMKATIERGSEIERAISRESSLIQRARALAERAIPPGLTFIDQEQGKIESELEQINRMDQSLGRRTEIASSIVALEEEVAGLEAQAAVSRASINYEEVSLLLSDRMNDYLNALNVDRLAQWQFGRLTVKVDDRDMRVNLGDESWTQRGGGSVQYIVQIAYHYALLSLTKDETYNYPGYLMIDFPPQLATAEDLGPSENYLIEPFVTLCSDPRMKGAQVIIAGRAFDDLEGANMIRLGTLPGGP